MIFQFFVCFDSLAVITYSYATHQKRRAWVYRLMKKRKYNERFIHCFSDASLSYTRTQWPTCKGYPRIIKHIFEFVICIIGTYEIFIFFAVRTIETIPSDIPSSILLDCLLSSTNLNSFASNLRALWNPS